MAFNLIQEIRKQSREQWRETLWEKVTNFRIWIQENGELAFLAAIVLGVLLATFFKVFAFLAALGIITAFGIYLLARPEAEITISQSQFTSESTRVEHPITNDTSKLPPEQKFDNESADRESKQEQPKSSSYPRDFH